MRFRSTRIEGVYSVSVPHATKAGYSQLVGYVDRDYGEIGGSGNAPIYGTFWTFTREGVKSVAGFPTRDAAAKALIDGMPTDAYTFS